MVNQINRSASNASSIVDRQETLGTLLGGLRIANNTEDHAPQVNPETQSLNNESSQSRLEQIEEDAAITIPDDRPLTVSRKSDKLGVDQYIANLTMDDVNSLAPLELHAQPISQAKSNGWFRSAWLSVMAQSKPDELYNNILLVLPGLKSSQTAMNDLNKIKAFCEKLHDHNLQINHNSISDYQEFEFPSDVEKALSIITKNILVDKFKALANKSTYTSEQKYIATRYAEGINGQLNKDIMSKPELVVRLIRTFDKKVILLDINGETNQAQLSMNNVGSDVPHYRQHFSKDDIKKVFQNSPMIIRETTGKTGVDGKPLDKYAYVAPLKSLETKITAPSSAYDDIPLAPYPMHQHPSKPEQKIIDIPSLQHNIIGSHLYRYKTANRFLGGDTGFNKSHLFCPLNNARQESALNAAWISIIISSGTSLPSRIQHLLQDRTQYQVKDAIEKINVLASSYQNHGLKGVYLNGAIKESNALRLITIELLKNEIKRGRDQEYTAFFKEQMNSLNNNENLSEDFIEALHFILQSPSIIEKNPNSMNPEVPPILDFVGVDHDFNYISDRFLRGVTVDENVVLATKNLSVITCHNEHYNVYVPVNVFAESMAVVPVSQDQGLYQNSNQLVQVKKSAVVSKQFDMPEDVKGQYEAASAGTRKLLQVQWPLDIGVTSSQLLLNRNAIKQLNEPKLFISVSKGFFDAELGRNVRPQTFLSVAYNQKLQHTIAFRPDDHSNTLSEMIGEAKKAGSRLVNFGQVHKSARIVDFGAKFLAESPGKQKKKAEYSGMYKYFLEEYTPNIDHHLEPGRGLDNKEPNRHLLSYELPLTEKQIRKVLLTLNREVPVVFKEERQPLHSFGKVGNDHLTGFYETGRAKSTVDYSADFTDVDFLNLVMKISNITTGVNFLPDIKKIVDEYIQKRVQTKFLPDSLKAAELGLENIVKNKSLLQFSALELFKQSQQVYGVGFHELRNNKDALKLMLDHDIWRGIVTSLKDKKLAWSELKDHYGRLINRMDDSEEIDDIGNLFDNLVSDLQKVSKRLSNSTSGVLSIEQMNQRIKESQIESEIVSVNPGSLFSHVLGESSIDPNLEANIVSSLSQTIAFITNDIRDIFFEARGEVFNDLNSLYASVMARKDTRKALNEKSSYAGLTADAAIAKMTKDFGYTEEDEQAFITLEEEIASKIIRFNTETQSLLDRNAGNSRFLEPLAQSKLLNVDHQIRDKAVESIALYLVGKISPIKLEVNDPHLKSAYKEICDKIKLESTHEFALIPSLSMTSEQVDAKLHLLGDLLGRYAAVALQALVSKYQDQDLTLDQLQQQLNRFKENFSRPIGAASREDMKLTYTSLLWSSFAQHAELGKLENASDFRKMLHFLTNPRRYKDLVNLQRIALHENTAKTLISMFAKGVGAVDPFDSKDVNSPRKLSNGVTIDASQRTRIKTQESGKSQPGRTYTIGEISSAILKPIRQELLTSVGGLESRIDQLEIQSQGPRLVR